MRAFTLARLAAGPAAVILILSLVPAASAASPGFHVVAEGLHSPRGLSFGPGGTLYAAEAGDADHAGSILQITNSGSQHATVRTLISGIASIGEAGEFLGVDGISVLGRGTNQRVYGIVGASPQATGSE